MRFSRTRPDSAESGAGGDSSAAQWDKAFFEDLGILPIETAINDKSSLTQFSFGYTGGLTYRESFATFGAASGGVSHDAGALYDKMLYIATVRPRNTRLFISKDQLSASGAGNAITNEHINLVYFPDFASQWSLFEVDSGGSFVQTVITAPLPPHQADFMSFALYADASEVKAYLKSGASTWVELFSKTRAYAHKFRYAGIYHADSGIPIQLALPQQLRVE